MTLGEFIRGLREGKGFSQRQLAELTKVSNTEISRLESGERKSPSPNILKAIAPYLDVSYGELMTKAGYIEEKLDREKFTEHIWKREDGVLEDTYRMAKDIYDKDSDLIRIMNRATEILSDEDINTIKTLLETFASDKLTEDEKTTLKTIASTILKSKTN